MIADLMDLVDSLIALMETETENLRNGVTSPDSARIAEAKGRLTASLEKEMARLDRGAAEWLTAISPDDRDALSDRIRVLEQTARTNAEVIARSLRLSGEIIHAISEEARRATGRRSVSYRPSGALNETSRSAPISVNTAL